MKQVGLKFMLDGMQFLSVLVTEARATEILQKWTATNGAYKIMSLPGDDIRWAIDATYVQAIHTFDPGSLQQQAEQPRQAQPVGPVWAPTNFSGLTYKGN